MARARRRDAPGRRAVRRPERRAARRGRAPAAAAGQPDRPAGLRQRLPGARPAHRPLAHRADRAAQGRHAGGAAVSAEGGTRAIVAALAANLGIAITKFVAFLLTGSSSMLAESIHSLADSGNQVLLLVGGKRARRTATAEHPFGYGRERYVYAFIVSVVLFSVGGLFALYEGWHKVHAPRADRRVAVGADRGPAGGDRPGELLLPHRDPRVEPDPRAAVLGAVHPAGQGARAAGRPARGLRGADRPGLRADRRRADPDHRQRRLGRPRHAGRSVPCSSCVAVVLAIETKSLLLGEGAGPEAVARDPGRAAGRRRRCSA